MSLFETKRLIMRKLESRDVDFIFSLVNDPSFLQNIGDRGIRTHADALAYIEKALAGYEANGFGMYVVETKDSPVPMGLCGLVSREGLDGPDIGFAFLPPYWGKGYARESAEAVVHFARNTVKLKTLLAIASADNLPSVSLLEKLGLRFVKMIEIKPGDPVKLFSVEL